MRKYGRVWLSSVRSTVFLIFFDAWHFHLASLPYSSHLICPSAKYASLGYGSVSARVCQKMDSILGDCHQPNEGALKNTHDWESLMIVGWQSPNRIPFIMGVIHLYRWWFSPCQWIHLVIRRWGVYSVRKAPDEWPDVATLIDNNYRMRVLVVVWLILIVDLPVVLWGLLGYNL